MAVTQATSRLEVLQARFQQKQMQEKEERLLQLYDQQQQRAYQVVQRGSAGSTGSNVSQQHSITKTTTTTHTRSTSQGGKVRQMFDERRQGPNVKGIDRSHPLEPLDNKSKRHNQPMKSNPNAGTVTRQSVTVRRTVARADVNSNVNGGKPIVSYKEDVYQQSFGGDHQNNHRNEDDKNARETGVHIEEILNDDRIERNRMLAKIHLMEYDRNLKNRVNNDLIDEQFPHHLMVDVPDKLPRKPVATKKLSQAEARLERFKNNNAKKNNVNTTTVNNMVNRSETRKRSEPMFPSAKTTSRESTIKSKATENINEANGSATNPFPKPAPMQDSNTIARKMSTPDNTKTVEPNSCTISVEPIVTKTVKPVRLSKSAMVQTSKPINSPRVQKSPSPEPGIRKFLNSPVTPDSTRQVEPNSCTMPIEPVVTTKPVPPVKPIGSGKSGMVQTPKPVKSPGPASRVQKSPSPEPGSRKSLTITVITDSTKLVEPNCNTIAAEPAVIIQTMKPDLVEMSKPVNKSLEPSPRVPRTPSPELGVKKSPISTVKTPTRRSFPVSPAKVTENTQRNQRHQSPITSSSTRPSSDHLTDSSTNNSARDSPKEHKVRQMTTKANHPTRTSGGLSTSNSKVQPAVRNGPAVTSSDGLVSCKICGRNFAEDRISLHEKICSKTGQKKRKQFNAALHRVQGTELEAYAKKGASVGRQAERVKAKKPEAKTKSNWRRKHEDFINAIRSAKQVQAHLAAGGKLSDLPPPPASDTSDYTQCPHCGRKFNQSAAERHIPKCATMMHNKPNRRAPPKPQR